VSRASDRRRRLAHAAAPVLFLAAVTVAVLLVRSGLHAGHGGTTTVQRVTSAATSTVAKKKRVRASHARFYTVQTGDTFGSISAKTGVGVSELERLNPGVSSNALQIGQKLRVK
jgi:LysM repeat protein